MQVHFFTKSKKVVYDTEGMNKDFNFVKHIVETTVSPTQFPALTNLVNAFANKWKPIYPQRLFSYDIIEHNQEYEDAVNYLRLKLNYEYEKAV